MNKYYKLILIFVITILLIVVLIMLRSSDRSRELRKYSSGLSQIQENINNYSQKTKADKFGSSSPQGTYRLFLDALKKNNVALASKYFDINNQEKYQKLLLNIKANKGWEQMMNDLVNSQASGQYQDSNNYVIPIVNKSKELVTTVHLVKINNIWKIAEF